MKPFLPAVVTLVVGILVGAWQPRGELLALRAEVDELRGAAKKPCRGATADQLRSLLRAEPPARDDARDEDADAPAGAPEAPTPDGADDADAPEAPEPPAGASPEELRDGMHTALDARRAQARAALAEQSGLEEAQLAEVDRVMDAMNDQLEAEIGRFVDEAVATGNVDRRDMMDFAAEALDIVIAADDGMRKALPAELYDEVDESALDPLSFLEGDTLDALGRLDSVPGLE